MTKRKIYKISNGERIEMTDLELEEYENSAILNDDQLENIKSFKIKELSENTMKTFYNTYPLYRQCNIAIFGTEEEKAEFKRFHKDKVAKYDEKLEAIKICTTLEQLKNL